ncbi:acyltransferase [Rhizorhabdus dicambivorans]|uniref:Acyltransferase n=2 Tax=Rhizorhabdus dicambivorans TaxID=1850238 RepID=A0A2A4FU33_9SPHN|nr:acyltransferase [Rhizorhabdus dicambivorans]PCE42277.1 acyltransferase [Rhizorhabdus dicambivorans]
MLPPDAPAWRMAQPPLLPVSQAIAIARLICILGIVWVHGWTGLAGDEMAALAGSGQDLLRWTVIELFGRSAVPLLSIVSGWLVAHSLAKRGARRFLSAKARTVLVPMLLWNAIALVLVVGAGTLGLIRAPLLGDARWIADNMLDLTRAGDINVQTNFLRDLFLCMLAAPLLARLRSRWLLLIGGLAAVWVVGAWQLYLLLRPGILLFFVTGILARRHDLAERLGTLAAWRAALPFALVVPLKIWLSVHGGGAASHHVMLAAAVDLATRAAAALLVWRTTMGLARWPVASRLLRLERYAFFLFCSHLLFMWLLAPAIGHFTGPMGGAGWPIFFLVQPLLALGFAMLLAQAIEAISPGTADLLSGGRLGRDQAASPAARPLAHAHWKL